MRQRLVLALLALTAALAAGCGSGSPHGTRAPTAAERAQIVHWMTFWWRNSDSFAAVRTFKLTIGEIRVSRLDAHFATVRTSSVNLVTKQQPEPQKLGFMHVGGVWEIVVGPGDWSGVCTSPSPKALVDLYCSERSTREPPTIPSASSS